VIIDVGNIDDDPVNASWLYSLNRDAAFASIENELNLVELDDDR
jgi:hypothetical protein